VKDKVLAVPAVFSDDVASGQEEERWKWCIRLREKRVRIPTWSSGSLFILIYLFLWWIAFGIPRRF